MTGLLALWEASQPDDPLTSVASSKPVVIIAIAVAVLIVIAAGGDRISGPFYRMLATRRRAASDKDDADITDLKRQVKNLEDWRQATEGRMAEHAKWDSRVYQVLLEAGSGDQVGPPPPLF